MSDRDVIARIIEESEEAADVYGDEADALADQIVVGLREARTLRTVAELDALPVGSIIRDEDGDGLTKTRDGRWECHGDFSPYPTTSIATDGDTLLVLYRPDEDGAP